MRFILGVMVGVFLMGVLMVKAPAITLASVHSVAAWITQHPIHPNSPKPSSHTP